MLSVLCLSCPSNILGWLPGPHLSQQKTAAFPALHSLSPSPGRSYHQSSTEMLLSRDSTDRLVLEVKHIDGDIWKFSVSLSRLHCRSWIRHLQRVSLYPQWHCWDTQNCPAASAGVTIHPPLNAQTIFPVFYCWSLAVPSSNKELSESPQVLQGACQGLCYLWVGWKLVGTP